ncbi:serine hydrolase domain-containing protein [Streptomyces sp. DSM 44917]|uniref:Serine hydrolase domain-containing protein n=1 Tax=Streptomyces boetiae TaxID=3075541 RepID=A0ABU2L3Q7_9ACTN|nr:serine hydrolase domain-containing protein [Streptomyces sp. DSM 44917]MDT0306196.1 serine hydrolase domain-containing protein [Streptomyces sp. DSM 44917]
MSRGPGRRSVASGIGLGLAAGAAGAPAASGVPAQAEPEERLRADVEAVAATGVVAVVARVETPGGAVAATAGEAALGTGRPVPPGALVRVGSTSKPFLAVVVLQLAEEGVLSLEEPVEHRLPGLLRGGGNDGRALTVRQLLQHTGGVFDYLSDAEAMPQWRSAEAFRALRFRRYAPAELIRIALRHPPDFPPGTGFAYSNTGYQLLALIVEQATGLPWEAQVARRVLRPLGLRDTLLPGDDPAIRGPHPRGYWRFPDAAGLTDVTVVNQTMAGACGAIVSTAADITRFFGALLGGLLLSPGTLAAMRSTVPAAGDIAAAWPGSGYGLGLQWVPQGGYWGHNGDTLGYSTRTGATADGSRRFFACVTGYAGPPTEEALTTLAARALGGDASGG